MFGASNLLFRDPGAGYAGAWSTFTELHPYLGIKNSEKSCRCWHIVGHYYYFNDTMFQ